MMIMLTTPTGARNYVHHDSIARITEAAPSSQWHGIRSIVKTFDGQTLECSETAKWIVDQLSKYGGKEA